MQESKKTTKWAGRAGLIGAELGRSIFLDDRVALLTMESLGVLVLVQAQLATGRQIPANQRDACRMLGLQAKQWKKAFAELCATQPPLLANDDGFLVALPFRPAQREGAGKRMVIPAAPRLDAPTYERTAQSTVAGPAAQLALEGFADAGQLAVPQPAGSQPATRDCPFDTIGTMFNQRCACLPAIRRSSTWPAKRRILLHNRWNDHPSLEFWEAFFTQVAQSDELCGRGGDNVWRADFDWVLQPANFKRIVAGEYQNRQACQVALFDSKNTEVVGHVAAPALA